MQPEAGSAKVLRRVGGRDHHAGRNARRNAAGPAYAASRNEKDSKPMGFFNSIMKKLGLAKDEPAPAPAPAPAPVEMAPPPPPPPPAEIPVVDVVSMLEGWAAANPQKLNWKTSIVDLLKLLDIDSSYSARKELAVELGCPAEKMGDSAQMNMWLHKTVLKKIAENGGNVPSDLYD
jgi:hypothetical protein